MEKWAVGQRVEIHNSPFSRYGEITEVDRIHGFIVRFNSGESVWFRHNGRIDHIHDWLKSPDCWCERTYAETEETVHLV